MNDYEQFLAELERADQVLEALETVDPDIETLVQVARCKLAEAGYLAEQRQ